MKRKTKLSKVLKTEVQFVSSKTGKELGKFVAEGAHDLGDPTKILKLMDLLNLPKGTTAKIVTLGTTSIVR
ncbi:MAG: hypothetical protein DME97_14690 [Verrucomicrobia bacterium]|nr:MAG: hypothetical protein DME97_14690 [Verrucomicrobiota bacterium]